MSSMEKNGVERSLSPSGNEEIERAIECFHGEKSKQNLVHLMSCLVEKKPKGFFLVPVDLSGETPEKVEIEHTKEGDVLLAERMHLKLHRFQSEDGRKWPIAFTSLEELEKGGRLPFIRVPIQTLLKDWEDSGEGGILINPWGCSFFLTKELLLLSERAQEKNRISLEQGDISRVQADAIVNSTNRRMRPGGGTDTIIHRAAGPGLLEECQRLGELEVGQAKLTTGGFLPAKYVIHTVGPRYGEKDPNCRRLLRDCYRNCLDLALENKLHSIAFPSISTGAKGYPPQRAATIALMAIEDWFAQHPDAGMLVRIICFSRENLEAYQAVQRARGKM